MTGLSPEFERRLVDLLAILGRSLGRPPLRPQLEERAHEVKVAGDTVHVPIRFEVHWRRFGTMPTDLVRGAAYAAARAAGQADEAEAQVFAEAFLRDHVLNAD